MAIIDGEITGAITEFCFYIVVVTEFSSLSRLVDGRRIYVLA